MSDSYLPPAEITRRQIIRKVAGRARVHGWQWAGNHDGWWTPNGDLVTVDQLFPGPVAGVVFGAVAGADRGAFRGAATGRNPPGRGFMMPIAIAEIAPVEAPATCPLCGHIGHPRRCLAWGCRCEPVVSPPLSAELEERVLGMGLLVTRADSRAAVVGPWMAAAGWETVTVRDYDAAVRALIDCTPELVVIDLVAPRTGLRLPEFHAWLRQRQSDGPRFEVVYLLEKGFRLHGLRPLLGPMVRKPLTEPALRDALARVVRRTPTEVFAEFEVDVDRYRVRGPRGWVSLTPIETRLLTYLAGRSPLVCDYVDLARNVWGYVDPVAMGSLVRAHVSNMRTKLRAAGLGDVVETVRFRGYAVRATGGN